MSELADEADSKSVGGNVVWVQVPSPAFYEKKHRRIYVSFFVRRKDFTPIIKSIILIIL